MANILDSEAGSERFNGYETDFKLVQADLNQKLDEIPELSGEPRKAAIHAAERALDEADELLGQMRLEKSNLPGNAKQKILSRFRDYEQEIRAAKRKLKSTSEDQGKAVYGGSRYTDDPTHDDQMDQRQQLLAGTDRLERSSNRLRDSQRVALETEDIGRNTLSDLAQQREVLERTRGRLEESEGYTDRSIKTLRGMARRMATNKIITIAIITVLVLLIVAVIISKFR